MIDEVKLPFRELAKVTGDSEFEFVFGGVDERFGSNYYIVPKDQAIALYRGAKMILELEDANKISIPTDPDAVKEYLKSIELLKNGIGNE